MSTTSAPSRAAATAAAVPAGPAPTTSTSQLPYTGVFRAGSWIVVFPSNFMFEGYSKSGQRSGVAGRFRLTRNHTRPDHPRGAAHAKVSGCRRTDPGRRSPGGRGVPHRWRGSAAHRLGEGREGLHPGQRLAHEAALEEEAGEHAA